MRSSCLGNAQPRSQARRCSGATTIRLLSSLMALVRLTRTACRVVRTWRNASRSPRARGAACCSLDSALRAACTASMRSLLAPRARFPPGISTTSSPASVKAVTSPAAKLPVPFSAQTRRPGAYSRAQASSR